METAATGASSEKAITADMVRLNDVCVMIGPFLIPVIKQMEYGANLAWSSERPATSAIIKLSLSVLGIILAINRFFQSVSLKKAILR